MSTSDEPLSSWSLILSPINDIYLDFVDSWRRYGRCEGSLDSRRDNLRMVLEAALRRAAREVRRRIDEAYSLDHLQSALRSALRIAAPERLEIPQPVWVEEVCTGVPWERWKPAAMT